MKKLSIILLTALMAFSCIKNNDENEHFNFAGKGVYVSSEGNWGSGNATLSYYDPTTKNVENGVFYRANSAKFGDTAQSLAMSDGVLYAVINNSGALYAIDPVTVRTKGILTGLVSPRNVAVVSPTKGYISTMNPDYSNASCDLLIFNPSTMTVTGTIKIADAGNTEQMILSDGKLYVSCWTNSKQIAVIDTATDTLLKSIEVGIQPYSIALTGNILWVVCDGGSEYCSLGSENASFWKIDTDTYTATKIGDIAKASAYETLKLAATADGSRLYMLNGNLYTVDTTTGIVADEPFVSISGSSNYGLAIDPSNGDIYICDAKDFASNGEVVRYDASGKKVDTFTAGISPSVIAFK